MTAVDPTLSEIVPSNIYLFRSLVSYVKEKIFVSKDALKIGLQFLNALLSSNLAHACAPFDVVVFKMMSASIGFHGDIVPIPYLLNFVAKITFANSSFASSLVLLSFVVNSPKISFDPGGIRQSLNSGPQAMTKYRVAR